MLAAISARIVLATLALSASAQATVIDVPLSPANFGPVARVTDPGGGYTYVVDRAIATLPIAPRTIAANALDLPSKNCLITPPHL